MDKLIKILPDGSLILDGKANKAADWMLVNPQLFDQLVVGLSESDVVIEARMEHALERISRTNPEMVQGLLPKFVEMAVHACWLDQADK
jgi:hypothetical protein